MRQHLKTWLEDRKARRQKEKELHSKTKMPCLPSPRPRVLTPSSSEQDLSLSLQSSPLFTKLPTEIRRNILRFAFGDRTVHMHLVFETFTKAEADGTSNNDRRHARLGIQYYYTHDEKQPRIWKWKSCVCHRMVTPPYQQRFQLDQWAIQPAADECCSGDANYCRLWKEYYGTSDACFIGAMGWLLACRQSYVEGVDVLYHTNTIQLSSKDLLSNLPSIILPQRLSMITSLEVVWLIDSEIRSEISIPKQGDLDQILSILNTHFPKLQRLNLELELKLYRKIPVEIEEMIKTLDSFVARRGQYLLEPITISLASWAFEQLSEQVFERAKEEMGLDVFKSQSWLLHKLWHYLDGRYDCAPKGDTKETYGRIEGITAQNGYWFRMGGDDDKKLVFFEASCFGSGGTAGSRDYRFVNAPVNRPRTWAT